MSDAGNVAVAFKVGVADASATAPTATRVLARSATAENRARRDITGPDYRRRCPLSLTGWR
jgi:hypothetical protein